MKKILTIILTLSLAITSYAADLRWDASDGATGYNIYFNNDGSEVYPYSYDAGSATEVLDIKSTLNLQAGETYTFVATAYNAIGESGYSNSAEWTVPDDYNSGGNNLPITINAPATITITIE